MQAIQELNQQIQECDLQIRISSAQYATNVKEKGKLSASVAICEKVMKENDFCYHSVGRAFVLISRPDFEGKVKKDLRECEKTIQSATTTVEYLRKKREE
mmetsp:Transcript_19392/g.42880  ORF Transcript_19392/g.42880 Transcript_19392/m.42880 type:complete len:100 (-) Transcript_19392:248-547(-)